MMEKRSHNNNHYHLASRFPNISPPPTESFLRLERYMATSQILLLMRCRRRRKRPRSTAHRQHTGRRRRRPRRGIVTCSSRWLAGCPSRARGATTHPTTTDTTQTDSDTTTTRAHARKLAPRRRCRAQRAISQPASQPASAAASALAAQATYSPVLFARRSASLQ
ncbi:hypothetical protein BKA80DRAFT_117412 [Phyllosticta citrichinensis]